MTKTILLILLLAPGFFTSNRVIAQSWNTTEQEAVEAFEQRDFEKALARAESLLALDSQRVDALFIGGESARNLGANDLAEIYLSRIPNQAKKGRYAITDLRLAEINVARGKCEEGNRFFRRYLALCPDPDDLFARYVEEKVKACTGVQTSVKTQVNVDIRPLGKNINTPFSDHAPVRYADKMYFTTPVSTGQDGRQVNRIFTAIRDEPAQPFVENPKQTDLQISNVALTPNADRIYYTLCKDADVLSQNKCEIWFRDKSYEGFWEHPVRLPRHINLPDFTTTQPNIGFDRSSNKKMLYFVSNRPGGKGKLDIWCSVIERDGTFGEPYPLPINTPDDDVTPYFFTPTQTIYFSSNTASGEGGFDIYKAEKTAMSTWTQPQNLEAPLNTPYDETYFILHHGSHAGYFSSNRPNPGCPDAGTACKNFDLYEVRMFALLDLSVYNAADSSALSGSNVELIDMTTGQTDTTLIKMPGSASSLVLGLGHAYRLIVSQSGYYPVYEEIDTQRLNFSSRRDAQVFMKPMKKNIPHDVFRD